ncbi:MAG TPA: hypothetical protein VHC39_13220 [Rhizomicrobium sp.]|nr:hypothetical protein [Rhizomicrobium sp.]
MTPLRLRPLLLSALLLAPGVAGAQTLPAQSQAAFDAALHDMSPSPQFIAITVVNDETGQAISGCITARQFLGAMHREYDLGYDPDAIGRIMAAAEDAGGRTFHFRKDDAWAAMPARAWSARACDIIASGQVARLTTPSGQVIASAH